VLANGGRAGMQTQVGLLAHGLRDAGCAVTIACGPGHLDVHDVEVARLPALNSPSAPLFARELRRLVKRTSPHVVHGHGLRLAPLLRIVARRRSLVTCHGIDPDRLEWTAAMLRATRIRVASCGEGPRRLLEGKGVPSLLLNNAVPPMPEPLSRQAIASRFKLDPDATIVVSPARFTAQKDPVTMVRALAYAQGVSGILIGGGPLERDVLEEVSRHNLAGRVAVAGWLGDARAVLAGADIVGLASVWEGQPTVVLEAMAAGVPVVATACPGIEDTVVDGVTGLLAAPRDAVSLGRAFVRAAGDPALRGRLVAGGRAAVASHTVDAVVGAHLEAYQTLLAGRWPA
jgi:glycosyltransferase involved in cell wall biosynthesis